jgi:hypothetical protein
MIASRSGSVRLPRVAWRRTARRSLAALLDFLKANARGDPEACRLQIEEAIESLRYSPLRCVIAGVKFGRTFRRLLVDGRFLVYYLYTPPRGMASGGTISIRSVKHAASQNPFLDVREALASDQPLATLSTRDSAAESAATTA